MDINQLLKESLTNLKKLAKELGIRENISKENLVEEIVVKNGVKEKKVIGYGELDILADGYGFLRQSSVESDIYVSASQVRKLGLRIGDRIIGELREPVGEEKNYALLKIISINFKTVGETLGRAKFDELEPSYPDKQIVLENNKIVSNACRIIDIIAPIGKGQRALIVAPPKAGKTTLIIELANSIINNNKDIEVWLLLIDERPEEVTDIRSNVKEAKVFASTFDEDPHNHIKVTEMVLEKAKRAVEEKRDIVILMDSLTRLARSYNIILPSSGKLISGGLDPSSFYMPKRFFGAARNIKKGGSLTIIATALVDTGSKMDEVIYEEFKGTGNMEIHLDRELADFRIFPAIDVKRSGTRKEELLLDKETLASAWSIRKFLNSFSNLEATKRLIESVKLTKDNKELFKKFKTS